MAEQTCTYANTAVKKNCEKPAVAWALSIFSLGEKIYFCDEHLDKAKGRKLHKDTVFHKVGR